MPQESTPSMQPEPSQNLPQSTVQYDSELPDLPATISVVEGDVTVLKVDIAKWEDAFAGMELALEDTIKTGDDGTAVIVFFEGSTIELQPNTEVMIQELGVASTGSTTIKLWQNIGSTVNRVQKLVDSESRYEIQTPSGSAVVRGSVGTVIVLANGITLIYNEEGEWWAYANGQLVQIPPNWYITIVPGNPPGPIIPGQPQPLEQQSGSNDVDGQQPQNGTAPVAQFSASVLSGIAPLAVQFSDQSTGSISSWSWDFGDGVSDEQNPLHTFTSPGVYTVALTVSGPDGLNTLIKTDYIVVWGEWTQTTQIDFSSGTPENAMVLNVGGGDGSIVLMINEPTIVQDQTSQYYPDEYWYEISSTDYLAQTFCAGISGSLVKVELQLMSIGLPAPLVVELRNCDLVESQYIPGDIVLGKTIITALPEEINYTAFFTPLTGVTSGQHYSIVLYELETGGIEGSYFEWGGLGGDYYPGGDGFWSNDSGASWHFQEIEGVEDYYFATYVGQFYETGYFESSSYDCGSGATYGNLSWEYATVDSGLVWFQVATNNDDTTWNFVGPDGTNDTYYETSGTALWSGHNGDRYIKYKAYLMPGNIGFTPELKSVTVFYR